MKKLFCLITTLMTLGVHAQTVNLTSTNYTQDFNSLDTANANSSNLPTGWAIFETGTSANVNGQYKGSNGGSNAGETYSYGSNGSTDRSLGSIASFTNKPRFGVGFVNNTGSPISALTITLKNEQWRIGDTILTSDTTLFEYSTTATGISDTVASWLSNSALNLGSYATAGPAGAVDGNTSAYSGTRVGSINVSVPVGGTVYLRWTDLNIAGADDGLSLDDINITFTTGLNPKPILTSLSPSDNSTNLPGGLTTLTLNFDKVIGLGSGSLIVTENPGGATQIFTGNQITVTGTQASVPNVNLALGKAYHVTYDSTLFESNGVPSYGIYNNTDWNFSTQTPTPIITSLVPADNSVNVSLTPTFSITFDKAISAGTGNIRLLNLTDGTQNTLPVPSPVVVISGNTASVAGVTLLAGKKYCILFDSTCFNHQGFDSYGITDTNTWNFFTIPPALSGISNLNETFTTCANPILGNFVSYSVTGNQAWRCTSFGNGDNAAAVVNGFSGGAQANEDWLISAPLTITSGATYQLKFFSKKRFNTAATKEVLTSTTYTGSGDPNTAQWTALSIPGLSSIDTTWKLYTSGPFPKPSNTYYAFKYTSTTTAADEWSVDDVAVAEVSSIGEITQDELEIFIGYDMTGKKSLYASGKQALSLHVEVIDMSGKMIGNKTSWSISNGLNKMDLPSDLNSGVYMIRVSTESGSHTLKFVQ